MNALPIVVLLAVTATISAAGAETIHYATFTGENYSVKKWHSAPFALFKKTQPENVFDSYTVHPGRDGTIVVRREYATPSGDWRFELTYTYGDDRRLRRARSELFTFGGLDASGEAQGFTRCIRTFTVAPDGTMRKISERVVDEKTGRRVTRHFHEPAVEHWMTLDELPISPAP